MVCAFVYVPFKPPVCTAQVLVCVLCNGLNHEDWPRVVSDDILRHLEKLRSRVVTLRGSAEGRTLLPIPLCLERVRAQDIILRSVFEAFYIPFNIRAHVRLLSRFRIRITLIIFSK